MSITEKWKIRLKTQDIPQDLNLWSGLACWMVSKSFDISNANNQPALGMLKALSTLSATAAIRSTVEQEDINHTENQEKKTFLLYFHSD